MNTKWSTKFSNKGNVFFCKEIIKKMTIEYKFFVQILTLFEAVPFFDILCGKNLSSFLYVELVIIFNNIFFS